MTTKKRIQEFIDRWNGHGDEKQETQKFWLDLMQNVLDVPNAIHDTEFEHRTAGGGYIDVLCPDARFLVEQKSIGIDLDKKEPRQGEMVTPVEQALRYAGALPFSLKPSVICTCNFQRFRFYDLEKDPLAKGDPAADFTLQELGDHIDTLTSVFGASNSRLVAEQQLSEKAGILVANLHNAIAAQYADPDDPQSHHSLAVLTVRFVFALYAEDAGLFPQSAFSRYVESFDASHLRRAIMDLFQVLNTSPENRDKYLEPELAQFPYVNGGLFAAPIEIPQFADQIRESLLTAGDGFDWRKISPVIFGSLMEETLSHDQRRKGGMHYTTVKNIHKVIDPLFLDNLKAELDGILERHAAELEARRKKEKLGVNYVSAKTRAKRHSTGFDAESELYRFREKLGNLQFLDPACGSGNFLTETYLQLRALENRALEAELGGQGAMDLGDDEDMVKVRIDQFHGIEINDFAVSVTKTALWIAEQQALEDTEEIAGQALQHLPLHDSGNIIQANALQYDWNELLPGDRCSWVMGNPPFIGHQQRTGQIKQDMELVCGKDGGSLDYVAGWYYKAIDYLADNPAAEFAFVSTNSITQGQQVAPLFGHIKEQGWHIRFAHRTFMWDAQTTDNANVHVVVIGFSRNSEAPRLYSYTDIKAEPTESRPEHINGYLLAAPDVFVTARSQKKGTLSPMLNLANFGSMPLDHGNLLIETPEEYAKAMADPIAAQYVHPIRGGKELIEGKDRWCLWLVDAEPGDMRRSKFIAGRVTACREYRENATKTGDAYKNRSTPWLFRDNHQPQREYLAVPKVSGERREYFPCELLNQGVIASDLLFTIDDPEGFNFAIMESSMFITWLETVGGKLESRYRFSNTVVWNNLPLPQLSDEQRREVIDAGRQVIEVRARHEGQSLADLYDPDFMPADLRKAHRQLDKIVDVAFGAKKPCMDNTERLQILFDRYVEMTGAGE
ncbi:DNA methyltransferase [Bifidobacterium sp. DSM 109960]|uniref:site-specific DNA-methyltransferase (adenine-specific) n=1 Tax=Bifidobacterium erythrocebi TaxID=2675325 RepID=A0A7Y0EV94_9BIFI|nr:class I SAM-dependent DNA methyltransferase [Bifidobacterium sp. DSM 109960]NMM97047.1 DNA methyltransferase [Bifidobacterium sp. DSM 109960]